MTFVQRTDWHDDKAGGTPIMAADMLRIEAGIANSDPAGAAAAAQAAAIAAIPSMSTIAADPALRAAYGLAVVATVSASAALAVGKFTPVDATAAGRAMTLPTGAADGVSIGVEKIDSSTNAVTVTGNIRGVPATTITLPWQHETLVLRADSSGSWWPVSGHKTKTSLDAAYTGTSGSKRDGQNVRNLRRPTLVIDKSFPSGRIDHEIVHVDETNMVAYSLGVDRRIRKTTWAVEGDGPETWGSPKAYSTTSFKFAQFGLFFREPGANSIIMTRHDSATGLVLTLQRSTDDAATFSTVWTAPTNVALLGPWSVGRDAVTGYMYLMEYITVDAATTPNVSIWRSTDNGATWTVWKTLPRAGAGAIRHWHGCRFDSVSGRMYFFAGDNEPDAGMYRVNAGGTDIEAVVLNSHGVTLGLGSDAARSVDAMFFPNYIAWAGDSATGNLRRLARTQIGQAVPAIETIANINGTAWGAVRAAADGSAWVCSTSTEAVGSDMDSMPHLYAVTNDGAQVDEVGSVSMTPGGQLGFASISGLGANAGEGDAFWLRAHNYRDYPNRSTSAFQWRCRLVWGVTGLLKAPRTKPAYYDTKTINGNGTVAASGSLTFGHLRAPVEVKTLTILDWGIHPVAGSAGGTVVVQLWNVTTGAEITRYNGTTYHRDSNDDVGTYGSYFPSAGDIIEVRILETGGTLGATATAYITFGWAF